MARSSRSSKACWTSELARGDDWEPSGEMAAAGWRPAPLRGGARAGLHSASTSTTCTSGFVLLCADWSVEAALDGEREWSREISDARAHRDSTLGDVATFSPALPVLLPWGISFLDDTGLKLWTQSKRPIFVRQ